MGTKFMVTEEMLRKLFGYQHEDVDYLPVARRNLKEVHAEVFTSGQQSNKIKDLKPHYKLWIKILIGCVFHRKNTNSPDYINNEQIYILYCIGTNKRVDLPHALFEHFCTQVKDTREDGKHSGRLWIGNGRLISDVLIESGLVDHLQEAGQSDILRTIDGRLMDGRSLFRLKMIDEVQNERQDM